MRRRTFLSSSALAVAPIPLAGCLGDDGGSGGNGTEVADDGGGRRPTADGYAPGSIESPEPMDVDTDSFERKQVEGEAVPLAPIEVTYNWYARREARFADTRGEGQYDEARIEGAAWSPAPDGRENGPVAEWPTDDRIVCYCGCPHHLSSLRASTLISEGYEDVYVIDEGFRAWLDADYPVAGSGVASQASYVIRGRADARHAGRPVYAVHEPTDQREAAFVGEDGSYEITLHFSDLTTDSEIRVDAPDYTVVAPLSELTDGVVTG